jgi:hypothetical protein
MADGIEDNGIVGFFFAHAVNIKAVIASERITAVTFFIFKAPFNNYNISFPRLGG